MSTETFLQPLQERVEQGAPEWLTSRRRAAAESFARQGFPTPRQEAWKYTDVSRIAESQFTLASDAALTEERLAALQLQMDAHRLVFVDGLFSSEHSNIGDLPEGTVVEPLSQALMNGREVLGEQLGRLTGEDFSPFAALNTAFAHEGVLLHLGPNAVLEKPVYAIFVSRTAERAVMSHPRLLVRAERGSEASLIEHYIGEQAAANFTNVVGEASLDANARLRHYKLQEASQSEYHVSSMHIDQHRDSFYASYNLNLGGALVRNDLISELNDENATAEFWGLFFGQERQHIDNHTQVNHNAPRTYSNESYKGILGGRARGVFNGRVYIKRDAQQVRGYQNNANLLLSDRAEIDTKPELEIYADDVLCSHGATTGQLDENAIFALRARGISHEMARGLLTLAFATEVMEQIPLAAITERVERTVAGKLPDRFNLAGVVEDSAA
ncbi:Fe-S cluster assembly protein SufD [Kushneria phosphatilytica]|uniref:Fe-S cluster assembly protein SufD n=1 Tax=Kushneria phosphatilytica TaxID=657387 RepID=A0A1S1NUU4_9GAMM|nr:Fe-S cluster assembly protein SufD [Kushneria phosphatilytica]OHV09955.1 Fe-S cluster assembly protein SufD [Kushneria phosphatilytica]QEL11634.1 Fe-S cluster assembly protein SufD [Kushneria phosphatilytica]